MAVPYQQPIINTGMTALVSGGTSFSGSIDLGDFTILGIVIPTGFPGTSIKFDASFDGVNWYRVVNPTDGSDLSYTVAVGKFLPVDSSLFVGVPYVRFILGSIAVGPLTVPLSCRRV